jgi:hypothetical protein
MVVVGRQRVDWGVVQWCGRVLFSILPTNMWNPLTPSNTVTTRSNDNDIEHIIKYN